MTQSDKITAFNALHKPGDPLVLVNAWDVGSARAVAQSGAPAIATASWACAAANGFEDDETFPMDLALANAKRIVEAIDLPVSLDFEGGYATDPQTVAKHVVMAAETGIVGINLEDQRPGDAHPLRIDMAAARIKAARGAALIFINARIDLFLSNDASRHSDMLSDAIERARAYVEAGADGIFVPGLSDLELLAEFCAACPAPVNAFHTNPTTGTDALAQTGVARISAGPGPYRAAMKHLTGIAGAVYRS